MSERVIIFSVAPLWSPHFETELDLALSHRASGDEVLISACQGFLRSCLANPHHKKLVCVQCRSRFRSGLEAIQWTDQSRRPFRASEPEPLVHVPLFEDIEDLRDYTYDGVRVGNAAASSLVSQLRDSDPDMVQHAQLIAALVSSAIDAFRAATLELERYQPTLAYVFNGRFASTAPIVEACVRSKVRYLTHDVGNELGTFVLVPAPSVHNIDYAKGRIQEHWENHAHDPDKRHRLGREFFVDKRYGGSEKNFPQFVYTSDQVAGLIPKELRSADYIAIFNSSEDEFSSLGDYKNPIYPDQMSALDAIVSDGRLANTQFVLRAHPNLRGLANAQTRHLETVSRYSNVLLLAPDDPSDTYALMEHARSVVTFGSTTGVEAMYWGIPSILVGRAVYEELGCLTPASHDELVELLLSDLQPAGIEGAIKYGFYARRGSHEFQKFNQTEYGAGTFDGREVRPANPLIWLSRVVKLWSDLKSSPGERGKILAQAMQRQFGRWRGR